MAVLSRLSVAADSCRVTRSAAATLDQVLTSRTIAQAPHHPAPREVICASDAAASEPSPPRRLNISAPPWFGAMVRSQGGLSP